MYEYPPLCASTSTSQCTSMFMSTCTVKCMSTCVTPFMCMTTCKKTGREGQRPVFVGVRVHGQVQVQVMHGYEFEDKYVYEYMDK
jgi:hypothetical protein